MNPRFSYSFDRESWQGDFTSREQATAAGQEIAHGSADGITTVYVGQRLAPNPRAYGNARVVIDAMARKAREDFGDEANTYLKRVPEKIVADLDRRLETTLLNWLESHRLMPPSSKVEAISEHPVFALTGTSVAGTGQREVNDLGDEGYFT